MGTMRETCSVCGKGFEPQLSYQMEERGEGFWFFCSQGCQQKSHEGGVTCEACHKSFRVELVAQVLTIKSTRHYACSDGCRAQILAEAHGARLGDEGLPAVLQPGRVAVTATATATVTTTPTPTHAPTHAPTPTPTHAPTPTLTPTLAPTLTLAPTPTPTRAEAVPTTQVVSIGSAREARKLAVFNHKGGTGKTTTSVSLAAAFAQRGLRVLLVDTDAQGNVGVSLGMKVDKSLYHVLVMGMKVSAAAINVRPNFDVLPSNETLAAAELYLAGRQNRDRVLRDRLASATADYDVVLLDCSPSLSLLNQNALVFADGVVVPVACDFLSLVGVRQVLKTVKNVNQLLHHPVQIEAVLPTFYDGRARICRDAVDTLTQHFGDRCLSPIRLATKVKEAPAQGKTLFEHAPESSAAEDYLKAADRILGGVRQDEKTNAPAAAAG
jgi:chromosome partitioning protein